MYRNLNYFYEITGPLHNHKSYEAQKEDLNHILSNMTYLKSEMDATKGRLDDVESRL